jgi:hypothetical protein
VSDEFKLPPRARELLNSLGEAERLAEMAKRDANATLEYAQKAIGVMQAQLEAAHAGHQRALDAEHRELDGKRADLDALIRDRFDGFEFIARAWADYELALAESQAGALVRKRRPAKKAADTVREKGRQLAEARRRAKLAEWIVALYEFHFPWLPELRNLEEEQSFVEGSDDGDDPLRREDPAARWLSAEEWKALPTVERNQRALDRYLASRKTPWQIGRDYERYVGAIVGARGVDSRRRPRRNVEESDPQLGARLPLVSPDVDVAVALVDEDLAGGIRRPARWVSTPIT